MSRKFLCSKEEIIAAGLQITREKGIAAVTARSLGKALNVSTKPIFSQFDSMEAVHRQILLEANACYERYLKTEMDSGQYPAYKASGMAYIRFARQERELYKLLFMRDRSGEQIQEEREAVAPIVRLIMENTGLCWEEAYRFHLEMWVYVHGIATMIATSYLEWDELFVSQALTDAYQGLKCHYLKG